IESYRTGATSRMRRVSGDLNRILVTVNLLFENVGRHFSLAQKAFSDAATDIDHAGDARANADLGHVQHVLDDIELKIIFLFKPGTGDSDCDAAVCDAGAKDRDPRLIGRGEHSILRCDLSQLTAEQMQKLTRRVRS